MVTAQQALRNKGNALFTIAPDNTVYEAVAIMAEKAIGALPVMVGQELVGIITERDYLRKIVLQNRKSRETLVREIMTAEVLRVTPDESVDACMGIMNSHRIRHLPVMDGGTLLGMLSIKDMLTCVLNEKQLLITQLENYISGSG